MVTGFMVLVSIALVHFERKSRKNNPQKLLRGKGVMWQAVISPK
jgi:hypothetical protein